MFLYVSRMGFIPGAQLCHGYNFNLIGFDVADIDGARDGLVKRILDGTGKASNAERRAAFHYKILGGPINRLVDKVVSQASTVTEEDIAAAKASGFSEDQIFEIVVCAAVGEATRQYETALEAFKSATGKK